MIQIHKDTRLSSRSHVLATCQLAVDLAPDALRRGGDKAAAHDAIKAAGRADQQGEARYTMARRVTILCRGCENRYLPSREPYDTPFALVGLRWDESFGTWVEIYRRAALPKGRRYIAFAVLPTSLRNAWAMGASIGAALRDLRSGLAVALREAEMDRLRASGGR